MLWLPSRFRRGRFSPCHRCCRPGGGGTNFCTDCSGTTYPAEMQITVQAGTFSNILPIEECLVCNVYNGTFALEFIAGSGDAPCTWEFTMGGGTCLGGLWRLLMDQAAHEWQLWLEGFFLFTAPYTPPVDCNTLDIELTHQPAETDYCAVDIDKPIRLQAVA